MRLKALSLCCIAGFALSVVAAAWFLFISVWPVAALFAIAAVVLFILTLKETDSYRTAMLICDNPLLSIGMASITKTGNDLSEGSSVNVVVSGFGILMGKKAYKFGRDGIKLKFAGIDRECITLSFGDEAKDYSVRLLHGIGEKYEIDDLTKRLHYETGIKAGVSGW